MEAEYQELGVRRSNGAIVSCERYDEISRSPDPEVRKYKDDFSLVHFDRRGNLIKETPIGPDTLQKCIGPKEEEISDEVWFGWIDWLDNQKSFKEPTMEEALETIREINTQLEIYDYGTGEISNRQAVSDFYGSKLLSRIDEELRYSRDHKCEDRKPNQITKELWQLMRDMRAGRKPAPWKPQPKPQKVPQHDSPAKPLPQKSESPTPEKRAAKVTVQKRKRQNGDDYFLKTERGLVRNVSYREIFKGPGIVYEWLWVNVVRDQWKDTEEYPIKERYFDNGFLAYCSTYRQIAKACGMHKNTVYKIIQSFVENGIVETEPMVPKGKTQGQTVFILGTWEMKNGKRVETYFRDTVFFEPEGGKK
ncbi:MAG: helix-turn-helix domain-containing protein [Pseudomonadota bacterium]